MYLENVCLHGGPAPALLCILPVSALKESESTVDNRSMFSTTYLPIIAFISVCGTCFVKLEQKNPAVAAWTAQCPSLLAELTLATPGLLSSSTVSTTVFLATSFVEACASLPSGT